VWASADVQVVVPRLLRTVVQLVPRLRSVVRLAGHVRLLLQVFCSRGRRGRQWQRCHCSVLPSVQRLQVTVLATDGTAVEALGLVRVVL
jgi:hypothetical protein